MLVPLSRRIAGIFGCCASKIVESANESNSVEKTELFIRCITSGWIVWFTDRLLHVREPGCRLDHGEDYWEHGSGDQCDGDQGFIVDVFIGHVEP